MLILKTKVLPPQLESPPGLETSDSLQLNSELERSHPLSHWPFFSSPHRISILCVLFSFTLQVERPFQLTYSALLHLSVVTLGGALSLEYQLAGMKTQRRMGMQSSHFPFKPRFLEHLGPHKLNLGLSYFCVQTIIDFRVHDNQASPLSSIPSLSHIK